MVESELGTSKCILHWLLLYKLILYEEKMLEGENEGEEPGPPVIDLDTSGCSAASDQQPSNIPGSVTFLCSGLATNSIFFCFLFVKKSLLCLEGKLMTHHQEDTFL